MKACGNKDDSPGVAHVRAGDVKGQLTQERGRGVKKADQGAHALRIPGRSALWLSGSLFFLCGEAQWRGDKS